MAVFSTRPFGLPCATWTRLTRVLLAGALMAAMVVGEADNHGVVFIYPTDGQVYNKMDTINVTYTSPFPTPNLYLWCGGGPPRNVLTQAAPGHNATVPVTLNFISATRCWFNLRPGTAAGFGANSPDFDLIGEERKSGSRVFGPASSTVSTPTQSSTTTSADASVTPPASSSTPPSSTPGRSGLSVEAAAGIGTGVAVGILVICGVLAWIWRRRRRSIEGVVQEGGNQEHYQASHTSSNEELLEKQTPSVLAQPVDSRRDGYRYGHYGDKAKFIAELSSAHHTPPEIGSSQILDPRHPLAAPGRGAFM